MAISKWEPTKLVQPSPSHKGAATPDHIYTEVGRALHRWEHAESAMARLFQVLCESQSMAPSRAYGVVESPFVKVQALKYAGQTFFSRTDRKDKTDQNDLDLLLTAYHKAAQFRNNIAHAMTIGFQLTEDGSYSGYFLTPPSYTSKKVKNLSGSLPDPWYMTYDYYYTVDDITHYTNRFQQILEEAVRLAHHLNDKHKIIPPGSLHP